MRTHGADDFPHRRTCRPEPPTVHRRQLPARQKGRLPGVVLPDQNRCPRVENDAHVSQGAEAGDPYRLYAHARARAGGFGTEYSSLCVSHGSGRGVPSLDPLLIHGSERASRV